MVTTKSRTIHTEHPHQYPTTKEATRHWDLPSFSSHFTEHGHCNLLAWLDQVLRKGKKLQNCTSITVIMRLRTVLYRRAQNVKGPTLPVELCSAVSFSCKKVYGEMFFKGKNGSRRPHSAEGINHLGKEPEQTVESP